MRRVRPRQQTMLLGVGLAFILLGCSLWQDQPVILPPEIAGTSVTPAACPGGGAEPGQLSPSALLSYTVPHDVSPHRLQCDQGNNAAIKQLYDILSWQTFIAVNWPRDDQGQPLRLGDEAAGNPTWLHWKESYEVFRPNGAEPTPWGSPRTLPQTPATTQDMLPDHALLNKTTRLLYAVDKLNAVLEGDQQIDDRVLWDQNGNPVYYEMLMNEDEFTTITGKDTQLYNLQGQISYYSHFKPSSADIFSSGSVGEPITGAIELKLAWKILDPDQGDIPDRFFRLNALILNGSSTWITGEVGLVGVHISHKTASADNWVWSTFEQVDNLEVDSQAVAEYAGQGQVLKPSFFNPDCKMADGSSCPVNVVPTPDANGVLRTQVQRELPIPDSVASLNAQLGAYLGQQNSVWQYYRLINTQYPDSNADDAPTPPLMTNPVIETYDQQESCMSCHAGAKLAVRGQPCATPEYKPVGDFSWLLAKAQWAPAPGSTACP